MRIKKNIHFLILIFVLSSCSAQGNLKDYYFPISSSKDVKVYKYVEITNPNNIEYWKVTTNPKTNTILTESYTAEFKLHNIFEEQLNTDGAEIIRWASFIENGNEKDIRINGTVVDKAVYQWKDNGKYKYSVKYSLPKYGSEILIKERTQNSFENIEIKGIKYKTVKFMDEYEFKSLENEQNYEFYQFTYYSKNIGMVKYQTYYPDGTNKNMELEQILSQSDFEMLRK